MSQFPPALHLKEEDVKAFLACSAHVGSENVDASMVRYIYKRNAAGTHIFDLRKTWEKIILAARVIVAIENPKDICVVSLSPAGTPSPAQRAVLKFANYVGCRAIAGRITPGTFTNHQQIHYQEPRLLIASDPLIDHQPIVEASYVNLPVIAFANSHHSLRGIDIAIPINTNSRHAVALGYWMLAREVLRLRDTIPRERDWDVMVDMFIYREPEEQEKQSTENQSYGKITGTGWVPGGESAHWEPDAEGEQEGVEEGYPFEGGPTTEAEPADWTEDAGGDWQ